MTVGVVFCHGAWGYDDDLRLAESLAGHLGDGYEVRFPRLPDDDDAAEERGMRVIADEIARAPEPLVAVGHSAGGYLLLKHLTAHAGGYPRRIAAICLIATPFPGADPDWTFDGFDLPDDLARRLPVGVPVLLYASEDDETVPFAHRDRYAAALPGALTRTTVGGHQLNDDLRVVADDIRRVVESPARP